MTSLNVLWRKKVVVVWGTSTLLGERFRRGAGFRHNTGSLIINCFVGDRSIRSIVFVSANEQRPLVAASRPFGSNSSIQ